ncbi:MAG: DUF1553 domain-containing protein [Planctomycetia bacterium]|nr:DUF1553 domain-containing protein [Planctomycetia bacterium]
MRRPGAAAGVVLSLAMTLAAGPRRAGAVDFNRDVRPILSEACFACHGPDKAKRKGDLRLDTRDGAFAAEGVIVPGKPDESELMARLVSDDPDERMPPPGSGRSLTKAQVDLLRRWIAGGAEWKGHWAYIPPERPPVPDASGAPRGFVRNDVDRFVFAELAERGLTPSPEADRVTLARRLSFDLTGLPPTPAEVDAFVKDTTPVAYESMVDRLLASPHYGERMAAHWLDLVRYADTTGYHGDNHRDVTLYRDYVVDAFSKNLPFDRFTTEQIAGDLIPGAGDTQRVASGYNKLLMTTQEGGAQAKEYLAKYAADRVRNASTVWMGATLGCAECHDHKFDPFTARDFYRFAAFFADIQDVAVGAQPQEKIPTPEQAARARALDAEVAALATVLDTPTPELAAAQEVWETSQGTGEVEWSVLTPAEAVSTGGATLTVRDDGSVAASGASPERDTYRLTVKAPRPALTALRLEVLADGKLPGMGPGRAANGNFVLGELEAATEKGTVAWSEVTGTHSQAGFPVAHSADGNPETGWAILPETGRNNLAVYQAKEDIGGGGALTVTLRFHYGGSHSLGRFRLSATGAPRPVRAGALPSAVAEALKTDPEERTEGQTRALATYYRSIAPALEPTRAKLAVVKKARADLDAAMPTTLVTKAGAPRVMRILPRGNWLDDSGEAVTPSVPAFLKGKAAGGGGADRRETRLDLAGWLVSRDNPLTARVYVNRLWALLFGQGIVATPDDFGAHVAWPTHPELLDRLAVEFVDSGWDVKHVVRLVVTSGAYRQSSEAPESLRQKDPYNHWLARQGRFRLDAESVRDNALAVSGLLAPEVGGPTARPYQPSGYWSHLNFPKREYQADHGDGLYRRGLYTYWCRTFLHPSLLAFDAPTREECTVQRPRSNTPLQALVLLNDPIYVEAARALAERALREGGGSTGSRVDWVYRAALSRHPRPAEASVLTGLLGRHLSQYRADRDAASALIRTGERPVPADLDPAELAAWTSVARVVLNLHETITRN